MPPCSEPGCVSLATRGNKCAVHGAGYRTADASGARRCGRCHLAFEDGEWFRQAGSVSVHVGRCPELADVVDDDD